MLVVLPTQLRVTECGRGWKPLPERAMERGDPGALLATETEPVALPALVGAKATLMVVV